jgi:hypothetical protein
VFDAIVGELVTVESAQTVSGTEPKKTMRVANDLQDKIAWQPVGRRVDPHGKLFGRDTSRAENKQKNQRRNYDKASPVDDPR